MPALARAGAGCERGLGFHAGGGEALKRFDFGLLADLVNYDRSNVLSAAARRRWPWRADGALVSSAFVIGGILEVLGGSEVATAARFMHRFGRGGGHFFWRFVRLAAHRPACAACWQPASWPPSPARSPRRCGDSEWEPGGYLAGCSSPLPWPSTVAALFLLALDYARIRVARDDARKMLRAYATGWASCCATSPAYGIALGIVAILAGVMVLYIAYETNSPVASTFAWIAALFVLQQITVGARVFLRVALIGAERAYFERLAPTVTLEPIGAAAAVAATGKVGDIPTALLREYGRHFDDRTLELRPQNYRHV